MTNLFCFFCAYGVNKGTFYSEESGFRQIIILSLQSIMFFKDGERERESESQISVIFSAPDMKWYFNSLG